MLLCCCRCHCLFVSSNLISLRRWLQERASDEEYVDGGKKESRLHRTRKRPELSRSDLEFVWSKWLERKEGQGKGVPALSVWCWCAAARSRDWIRLASTRQYHPPPSPPLMRLTNFNTRQRQILTTASAAIVGFLPSNTFDVSATHLVC